MTTFRRRQDRQRQKIARAGQLVARFTFQLSGKEEDHHEARRAIDEARFFLAARTSPCFQKPKIQKSQFQYGWGDPRKIEGGVKGASNLRQNIAHHD
jgi:hypothetical protein